MIESSKIPFTIRVIDYFVNCTVLPRSAPNAPQTQANDNYKGFAERFFLLRRDNEKEAENSSESCSPTPAFSGHWCSSFYISRRLAAKLRPQHLKRLRETASAAFSKASELGDPLLFDPHINQEKEAENSSVSCSPASAFLWCWCSSFYIGRWLMAKLRYKYLKRLSWIVSTAFSKALELEDPLLFDPHIDHDKEAENSCVSCSPASAFSWRWHSSFYICHSDGS